MTEQTDRGDSAGVEQQVRQAAEGARAHRTAMSRSTELARQLDAAERDVQRLRDEHRSELADVERLEGVSFSRVVATVRGSRHTDLDRERAEADMARLKLWEAEARSESIRRDLVSSQAEEARLADAPAQLRVAMAAKEDYLTRAGDPAGVRLLEVAHERGTLEAELREVGEAGEAADGAARALAYVSAQLGSASGWSTYDTFFGGGAMSSMMKHERMDEAARAAAEADRCLQRLAAELADVPGAAQAMPSLQLDGMTRFVDIWFDNIFTDWAVRDRLQRATQTVSTLQQVVVDVGTRLQQRQTDLGSRLDALGAERERLLGA